MLRAAEKEKKAKEEEDRLILLREQQFQYIQIQFLQMLELFQMLQVYFEMQTLLLYLILFHTLFHLLLDGHLELQELFEGITFTIFDFSITA